jgi:hypothetical protein
MPAPGPGAYQKFTLKEFRVCVRAVFAFAAGYNESFRSDLPGLRLVRPELRQSSLIPLSQVNQNLGLAGQIRNRAGFEFFARS